MSDLATLLDHARLTDLERAILRAILPAGYIAGTARELSEMLDVNRSSLFRALSSLDRRALIMRSSKKGKAGSMTITFNGRALDNLRALCDHLGREGERPGNEYTPVRVEDEPAVRADRARLIEAKRARQAAALGNVSARAGGQE